MKKILGVVLAVLAMLPQVALADTCATGLQPAFTAQQANSLCTKLSGALGATQLPQTDNTYDLGSASKRWRTAYLGTNLVFGAATAKIIPGATGLNIRNNADSATNLSIVDAGSATFTGPIILPTVTKGAMIGASSIDADITSPFGTPPAFLQDNNNSQDSFVDLGNGNTAVGPHLLMLKTRGTGGDANTVVQSGDELGVIKFWGADGADYKTGAAIIAKVDAAPGTADMPGSLDFQVTPDGSATLASALKISNNGTLTIGNARDLNFSVSGGTIGIQEATAGAACSGTVTANEATPVVVSTSCATTGSRIFLTKTSTSAVNGSCYRSALSNGVSFTITCLATDTGTYDWFIVHEAP